MKLIEPKKCPFCGSEVSGGGTYDVHYRCGAHIWIAHEPGMWEIRGHEGTCSEILFKREQEKKGVANGQSG